MTDLKYGNSGPHLIREKITEVMVFLFLIVPSSTFSFFASQVGVPSFFLIGIMSIFTDLSLLALVLFFVWRNGEHFSEIGLQRRHWPREALLGSILFIPFFFGIGMVEQIFRTIGLSSPDYSQFVRALTPSGPAEHVLAVILVVVVALTEETIFRGYLIGRFRLVMNRTTAALLSASVFSLGHGYEGSAGAATVGVIGLIFAAVYYWRKSLVAPMVMHFLLDFLGIIIVPLFMSGGR